MGPLAFKSLLHRRWTIAVLLIAMSLTGVAALKSQNSVVPVSAALSQNPFFQDTFSGSTIDLTKWNTSFATSGLRWCPSTVANHEDVPGLWQDPSVTPCQGATQSPPYGSLSESNGAATLSSSSSHTAAYIWSGPPSKASPFPTTGNFILEVKLAYNLLAGAGDGLLVAKWNNTDPVGNNPPGGGHQRVFLVWADSSGLRVQLLGNQTYQVYNQNASHDYVLEYLNGFYSVFVDGYPAIGPVASIVRPNSMWLGNPVINWWQVPQTWSSFSISLIQVIVPAVQLSPSAGPIGTKVLVQGTNIPVAAVEVTFDDAFIGTAPTSNGNFTFTLDVPLSQNGLHQVKAIDGFGNVVAAAPFNVTSSIISSNLSLSLTVGTVYFPGDNAVASMLVTMGGVPSTSASLQVNITLTQPDNSKIVLQVTSLGNGLFTASYLLSSTAQIGTYSLVASAHLAGTGDASALAAFEVKLPWLSSQSKNIAIAGVASVTTLGVGLVFWRKGFFKRTSKDPF